ncbi:MAG: hypothetical protein ACI9YL_000094 [Luteibaculaceae bacterium]|jgi:hypothetical protein
MINWLEKSGFRNIFIIDNASTDPKLLDWYASTAHPVYRLDRNVGHEALCKTHVFQRFQKGFYVLNDPDLQPIQKVPDDFLKYFYEVLERNASFNKTGFGLKTDDIPDWFPQKKEVIRWENNLNQVEIEPGVWESKIDTTFALYRPGVMFQQWEHTLRTAGDLELRHLPWYENPQKLNTEEEYYYNPCGIFSSWVNSVKGKDDRYSIEGNG